MINSTNILPAASFITDLSNFLSLTGGQSSMLATTRSPDKTKNTPPVNSKNQTYKNVIGENCFLVPLKRWFTTASSKRQQPISHVNNLMSLQNLLVYVFPGVCLSWWDKTTIILLWIAIFTLAIAKRCYSCEHHTILLFKGRTQGRI